MRAPIEPGNPGWDPDAAGDRANQVGAALRGAGFIAIVIAFLFVSQQYVGGDDDDDPQPGPAAIYAAAELKPALEQLESDAVVEYGASPALRAKIENGSAADVFIGTRADTQTLIDDGRCTEPAAVTSRPTELASCLIDRNGARVAAGTAYLDQLTGISGRDLLLQSGFELPPR